MPSRQPRSVRHWLWLGAPVLLGVLIGGCSNSDDAGCLGPGGVYYRGKQATPDANRGLVCCEGLTTYHRLEQNGQDGSCVDPIIATFSCLTGSCGDGMCEDGERGPCGCEVDCADATP
jgi:hypothetical protein